MYNSTSWHRNEEDMLQNECTSNSRSQHYEDGHIASIAFIYSDLWSEISLLLLQYPNVFSKCHHLMTNLHGLKRHWKIT